MIEHRTLVPTLNRKAWRSKYGALEISEMRRLRQLEEKESTAEGDRGRPGTRHPGVEGRAGKKRLRPAVKRAMAAQVIATHGLSQRRACGVIENYATQLQAPAAAGAQPGVTAKAARAGESGDAEA